MGFGKELAVEELISASAYLRRAGFWFDGAGQAVVENLDYALEEIALCIRSSIALADADRRALREIARHGMLLSEAVSRARGFGATVDIDEIPFREAVDATLYGDSGDRREGSLQAAHEHIAIANIAIAGAMVQNMAALATMLSEHLRKEVSIAVDGLAQAIGQSSALSMPPEAILPIRRAQRLVNNALHRVRGEGREDLEQAISGVWQTITMILRIVEVQDEEN